VPLGSDAVARAPTATWVCDLARLAHGERPGAGGTWSSTADLDLHVAEPDGTEIYYGNTVSADDWTYGNDANGGCVNTTSAFPYETVTWPTIPLMVGTYTVKVVYYSECDGGTGPQTFHVSAVRDGRLILDQGGTVNAPGNEQDFTFDL